MLKIIGLKYKNICNFQIIQKESGVCICVYMQGNSAERHQANVRGKLARPPFLYLEIQKTIGVG